MHALCHRPNNPDIDRIARELVLDVIKSYFDEGQNRLVVVLVG